MNSNNYYLLCWFLTSASWGPWKQWWWWWWWWLWRY